VAVGVVTEGPRNSALLPPLAGNVALAMALHPPQDVPIWNAKRYEPLPHLSKADGAILAYRRWTSQFFGTDSISFEAAARAHNRRQAGLPDGAKALDW
jgi:hypothetical protein